MLERKPSAAGSDASGESSRMLTSMVELGAQRGRLLGFPTANLYPADAATRSCGVYAGVTQIPDLTWWPSAINVGTRPTFTGGAAAVTVEVHLIGFAGDLYGRRITVCFLDRLRDEMRFESVMALTEQLQRDVEHAQHVVDQCRQRASA